MKAKPQFHVSKVTGRNIKGRSFEHVLTPTTLIVGPNFSGKTAILEAIRLAFIGYIPENGKTPRSTFDLSSGREMVASIEIGPGEAGAISRRFWLEKSTVKQETATVKVDVGPFNTPLLDSSTYFEMTESERRDYVFSRVQMPEEFTVDGIIARLKGLTFGTEHSAAMETALTDVVAACGQGFKDTAIPDALSYLTGTQLKDELALWKKKAQESIGTVRVLTELKNREGECSAETLTDLRNNGAHLAGLLDECNREFGALLEKRQAAERQKNRRRQLETALAVQEPVWTLPTYPIVPSPELSDDSELKPELAKVIEELAKLPEPSGDLEAAARLAMTTWQRAHDAYVLAEMEVKNKQRQIAEVRTHETCPYCKSGAEGWQSRVLFELDKELEKLMARMGEALSVSDVASVAQNEADAALDASRETDALYFDLVQRKGELERGIQAIASFNERTLNSYRQRVADTELAHTKTVAAIEKRRDTWKAQRANDEAELARMGLEAGDATAETLETASAKADHLQAELNSVHTQIQTAERLANDLRRAAQAAEAHYLAQARADVIKKVKETLQEMKGEMVTVAFKELLATANKIAGGLLPSELAYSAEDAEIGRIGATGFIPHRTFSGTEKALAYVAIAAALSAKAPLRLLILDELARLTPSVQEAVLDRFADVIKEGVLDQVIAVLPMDCGAKLPVSWEGFANGYSIIPVGMDAAA